MERREAIIKLRALVGKELRAHVTSDFHRFTKGEKQK